MTTWWNFSTHIFTQLVHLVLMAALVLLWRQPAKTQRPKPKDQRLENEDQRLETATHLSSFILHPSSLVGLFVLQSLVYLGHFGFWMNMSLLGAFGLAVLLIAAWRGRAPWEAFWRLLAVYAPWKSFVHRKRDQMIQPWVLGWRKHAFLHDTYRYVDIDLDLRAMYLR